MFYVNNKVFHLYFTVIRLLQSYHTLFIFFGALMGYITSPTLVITLGLMLALNCVKLFHSGPN